MFALYQKYKTSFNYLGFVLGIMIVLGLQLGIITSIRTNDIAERSGLIISGANTADGSVQVQGDASTETLPADLASYDRQPIAILQVKTVDRESDRVKQTRPVAASHRRKVSIKPGLVARAKNRKLPARVKLDDSSEKYAIKNVRPEVDQRSDAAKVIVEDVSRPDRRSFVAGALPIIKKPYNWLKAVGAKIF